MTIREILPGQSGLPVPDPTKSYWHREPSKKLLGHRTTVDLPETADIVIIGSGITGSFAAHFLKNGKAIDAKVLVLEAREACWGATGRNGGHCQPLIYMSSPEVAKFELDTYHFLRGFVEENKISCDWVCFSGVHAFLTQESFEAAASSIERLRVSHPELAAQAKVVRERESPGNRPDAESLSSLRIPTARGAVIQEHAASLWPYKLVAWVLEQLLEEFPAPSFNLQTNTPVTKLQKVSLGSQARGSGGSRWVLTTPRGRVTTPTVLLCTNAYTSRLLPAFSDLIVPTRGQIAAILPPRTTGLAMGREETGIPAQLEHSYLFVGDDPESGSVRDDYLVQRPLPEGELIFGGGRNRAKDFAAGEWRDDVIEEPVSRWLRGELSPPLDLTPRRSSTAFEKDNKDCNGEALLDASFEWTGIMGFSRDNYPWVGAVPQSLGGEDGGLWICGGYTGHGMPAAALSARAVVQQIVGGRADEEAIILPREFQVTEQRVNTARSMFEEVDELGKRGFRAFFPGMHAT
ncbi:hypothetical protein VTK73DRAFT_3325 [Phialemonium thermophilum]|uniref:FAD dependent oxidoreductase domain-containing protein n=1 Tax=Phialemonium thermophilum TaxID=223376 RepID=A0ABR3X060_9PEZI